MGVGVSYQGGATYLREGIPGSLFSMFDALVVVGVSSQGAVMYLRG